MCLWVIVWITATCNGQIRLALPRSKNSSVIGPQVIGRTSWQKRAITSSEALTADWLCYKSYRTKMPKSSSTQHIPWNVQWNHQYPQKRCLLCSFYPKTTCEYIDMHVYIYIYVNMYMYIIMYIYICIVVSVVYPSVHPNKTFWSFTNWYHHHRRPQFPVACLSRDIASQKRR